MKAKTQTHQGMYPTVIRYVFSSLYLVVLFQPNAEAQDNPQQNVSMFLRCADFSDRVSRSACLEDALEAALALQSTDESPNSTAPLTQTSPDASSPRLPDPAHILAPEPEATNENPGGGSSNTISTQTQSIEIETQARESQQNENSMMSKLRNFGHNTQASISTDINGQDELHDTITELALRQNLLIITLSSGQIWKQEIPRRFNLREGDAITIYQGGISNGYRLSTDRLSGFIQIKRLK